MTLGNCIGNKAAQGLVSKIKGKEAKDRFHGISKALIDEGMGPTQAYGLAAEQVVREAAEKAAKTKHRMLAQVATMERIQARLDATGGKEMGRALIRMTDDLDFNTRSIRSEANGKIGEVLIKHRAGWLGKVTDPAGWRDILRGMMGEAVENPKSRVFAQAINEGNEYFRLQLNAHGYTIGKLDNWGIPHKHDALSISRAGFEKWAGDIDQHLDWTRMTDPRTGKFFSAPPSAGFKREFLKAAYDNLIFGRASKNPTWGGKGGGNPLERHRTFTFRDSDAWLAYNDVYGGADPFNTLMQHIDHMSREVAMAKTLGHDPETAIGFAEQYALSIAREKGLDDVKVVGGIKGGAKLAGNMIRYMKGSNGPNSYLGAMSARFFSTTRKLLNAALLDRAVVISIPSDMNSARMAANAIGMNPGNVISTYSKLLSDAVAGGGATRDDLLRAGHIADSLANPGVTMGRYETEQPGAAWAEVISNGVMRVQGMNAHTDSLRMSFKWGMGGHLASVKDLAFDALPDALRDDMISRGGITAEDWDAFRSSGGEFTASNGATFLDPIYWHKATDLDPDQADAIFLKMQSWVEKWTELAVPTGSLIAKGAIDPVSYGLAPGSMPYEFMKSAGMFKSFVGAFVVNQVRMVNAKPTAAGKAAYIGEMLATTTLVGAIGIQINELLMGRDPQPMDEDFWMRAILRGGGLGPVGDILSTGSASWGGGLGSFVAGPVPQSGTDLLKLTVGNLSMAISQALKGEEVDVNFGKDLASFVKRYTPGGQSPVLAGGSAFDRMLVDQLWMALDPDAVDDLRKAAKLRENNYGNQDWWGPTNALPARAPDLGSAIGG